MKLFFLAFLTTLLLSPGAFALEPWQEIPVSEEIQTLTAHPLDPGKIIAASQNKIFEASETGAKDIARTYGRSLQIHRLLFFSQEPDLLFILTSGGLFKTRIQNAAWEKIYTSNNPAQNAVLSLALDPADPGHWFLGTAAGLLESVDSGKSWYRFSAFRKDPVSDLQFIGTRLFVCTQKGAYVSDDEAHFQMIFSLYSANLSGEESPETEEPETREGNSFEIHQILASDTEASRLWLATRKGVFESQDQGKLWQPLSQSGLKSADVRHLAYSVKTRRLFGGTGNGIYVYETSQKKWREMSGGTENGDILGLAITGSEKEILFAATPSGILHHALLPDHISLPGPSWTPDKLGLFRELLRLEPTASEIQNAVVRYANLRNGKTRAWQIGSHFAALLPTFSIGKDFSTANNVDIDRGGTGDPDRFIFGPEDISKKWDMNLGWDLGDFLFSSDQTSIDSREKLMVELRNDLVADATRIFFERRRLQMEILTKPSASEEEQMGKILRMDELTALLDGMTGGYLSGRLNNLYSQKPDLKKIWEFENPAG